MVKHEITYTPNPTDVCQTTNSADVKVMSPYVQVFRKRKYINVGTCFGTLINPLVMEVRRNVKYAFKYNETYNK